MEPYTRRKFAIAYRILLLLTTSVVTPAFLLAQINPHYNVLFIAVDDMNEKAGVFGYPEVLTPNLKRLAQRGIVFRKAYCQIPLCSPSRTSLLTGWRPDKTGVFDNKTSPRSKVGQNVKFLPEYFSQYGYHTERVGKMLHGGYQDEIAWDYSEKTRVNDLSGEAENASWWVTSLQDENTINGRFADLMIERMKKNTPQPFFLALGLTVHNPFTPSLKYWNMYGVPSVQQQLPVNEKGDKGTLKGNGSSNIQLPATPANDRNDVVKMAFPMQIQKSTTEWQNTRHAYFSEVTEMDAALGKVLDEMDRQNLWQNTVIVFWSDHGHHLGEHEGLWGKNSLFEESGLSPLIVCVPGKTPATCNALVELVDIYPSLAEICGLPAPAEIEGSSFARLLDDVKAPWKRAVFTQVGRDTLKARAVRTKQYRYNSWGAEGEELYDHAADPFEYTNLATNPAYISVLKKMRKILAQGWTRSLPPSITAKSVTVNNESISANDLQKNDDLSTIKAYPNPSSGDRILVEFKSSYVENLKVTIYNSEGKIVLKTMTEALPGSNQLLFRLTHFATGVYNIELKGNSTKRNAKFVIEK